VFHRSVDVSPIGASCGPGAYARYLLLLSVDEVSSHNIRTDPRRSDRSVSTIQLEIPKPGARLVHGEDSAGYLMTLRRGLTCRQKRSGESRPERRGVRTSSGTHSHKEIIDFRSF
jgi:hypothetical protein